jgi:hypothetical protein
LHGNHQQLAVTSINWTGVAADLGLDKIGSAQKRWSGFRQAKFGPLPRRSKAAGTPTPQKTPTKGGKKRTIEDMSTGEEEVETIRRLPGRKAKDKRVKLETFDSDEEDGTNGESVEEENDEKNGDTEGKEYSYAATDDDDDA